MRKIKAYTILVILSSLILSVFVSFTMFPVANAAEGSYDVSQGDHNTAQKKEWATTLFDCMIVQGESWPFRWGTSITITSKTLNGNSWFNDGGLWSSWTDYRSAYIEKQVTGDYSDGSILCGENNNALLQKATASLEIGDKEDLICDYRNHEWSGMLVPVVDSASCDAYYRANDEKSLFYRVVDSESSQYLTELTIAKNTGKAQIGKNDLFSLTDLETYYVKYDAFTSACVAGKAQFGRDDLTYTIQEINPSTGKVETAGYSGLSDPGENANIPWFLKEKSTCKQLAADLNSGTLLTALKSYEEYLNNNPEASDGSEAGSGTSSGDDTGDKAEDTCQSAGGAGSLGWIVCPILDWMQNITKDVYANYVEPSLQLETQLFSGTDTTYKAWTIFQGFANILFIILFLVIIFSQLTGVGIDNYGIKKLLPKLIVVAILVNLSYLICVICADLSNILGNALNTMFADIPIDTSGTVLGSGNAAGTTVITAVAIVAALAALGVALWQNPAILLTFFVAVLGVAISVLFLFVLLTARKAAVVVLTAISPLAFVCYMLPNTKKLFDRWLKFWEAMLLIYPICGLLIGGGDFASRLLLSTLGQGEGDGSDFIGSFTAMLAGIIPIFFIPTVVKSSFAAFGAIGSKIAGFGKTAQGWTTKKMRDSEGYKNAQKMGLDRKIRKQAGLSKQGDPTRLGRAQNRFARTKFGRLIGADTRLGAKTATTKKNIATEEEANATLMQTLATADMASAADIVAIDGAGNALTGKDGKPVSLFKGRNRENYYAGEFLKAAQSGDRKKMNSALAAAKSAGVKDGDIAKMVRHAENSGALNSMDADIKSAWLQSQATTNGAFAKDLELQHWAAGGGRAKLGDYGDYASANMDATDLDKKALGGASAESIAGLIKANRVSSGLAEQVMSDSSINLSPEKSIMLGAVKDGKINKGAISSAQALKEDAVSLSGGGAAGNNTIHANPNNANPNQPPTSEETASLKQYVDKWTAPPAERVTIDQQKTNKVPVKVTGSSSATTRTAPGATRGGPGAAAENQVFDVRAMSDETLLDMATNPNAADNDPTRVAAELEWHRRTNPNNHGGENFENGSGI